MDRTWLKGLILLANAGMLVWLVLTAESIDNPPDTVACRYIREHPAQRRADADDVVKWSVDARKWLDAAEECDVAESAHEAETAGRAGGIVVLWVLMDVVAVTVWVVNARSSGTARTSTP